MANLTYVRHTFIKYFLCSGLWVFEMKKNDHQESIWVQSQHTMVALNFLLGLLF